jgi:type IV pilus assembly protein PilY1
MNTPFVNQRVQRASVATVALIAVFGLASSDHLARAASTSSATPVSVAQVPLTVAIPAHPQVLFAFANSESVDGNLSGAIMTGSGGLAANLSGFNGSSSPVNYTVPAGFTAPITLTTAGNSAPYTVTQNGVQYDNSASRLNVAKGGLYSILQTFLPNADFALIDYQTSAVDNGYCTATACTTWVYYMSPAGSGFQFTNTVPTIGEYVANPCYNITLNNANPVDSDCSALNGRYPGINTYQYMLVGASSDDPSVNDVLYANGLAAACVVYGGPNPTSPFPPVQSLASYEGGGIYEAYNTALPGGCATETGPTNAGYVPYSQEVMYAQRGFGYYTFSQTSNPGSTTSWPPVVPMTSAGQTPTQASMNSALAVFAPYLAPETNSASTTEIKALATQSPIAGLITAAGDYYAAKNPASSNGCVATRYVVLVTDGLPTMDLNGNAWPPLGSAAATGYGVTATFNTNGSLASTNDQALTDAVNALQTLANNGVLTYVIGVGAGVNPAANPTAAATMTALAVAGGTGNYFAATTEAALNLDMQVILAKILAANQSTASTAVNTTGLNNGSVAYMAQFLTSDTYQDWTGDLDAYPVNPANGSVNTNIGSRIWSAKVQLDAQSWDTGRLIATWDPVQTQGIPLRWNASNSQTTAIGQGSTLGQQLSTFTYDTNGQDVLQFLRGSSAQELRNGGQFRNRSHKLGDIVASAPVYVGAPQGFSQTSSYFNFVAAHANRAPILYIGADDGMLHAIDAATGNERFAYVPHGVWTNLIQLVNPYYNEQHRFYVNGTPVVADVQYASDSSWHTLLVGSEGAGGSTLFGLDISSADQVTTEAGVAQLALWEFSDTDMGLSFSQPMIANTNDGWLVIAGNGYNSVNQKPVLYALNPQTGQIVEKLDLCASVAGVCNMSAANGLSSVQVINSYGESSLPFDTVYAGDLQGNIWRVNISNASPSQWTVSVIFQARDANNNPQPITTTPAVTLNPLYPRVLGTMVYVGTGELLGFPDLASSQVQSLYGIYDPPAGAGPPLSFSGIPTDANLIQQVMTTATINGVPVRVECPAPTPPTAQPCSTPDPGYTGSSVSIPTNRGWYINFNLVTGERIVANPQIEAGGGLVVTSYQPNTSSCTSGGNAWLSVFNYATGGSFALPELDVNGSGTLNSSDQINGYNPVGMSLGSVYASAATIISNDNNNTGNYKMNNLSNVSVLTVGDRGRLKKRIGWWEIRH